MSTPAPSVRSLLLPKEHGSWSLAFEPIALGLLAAPSTSGVALGIAVAAGFFTRRPLKLGVTLPAGDPRRTPARRWALLLASVACAALALAALGPDTLWCVLTASSPGQGPLGVALNTQHASGRALWPLLGAAPFGALFLWFDRRNEMRAAEAELAGCTAFGLVPAALASLAGWPPDRALALAALMLARSLPTVLAVRAFLRAAKGEHASAALPLISAAGAVVLLAGLAGRSLVPWLAAAWALLLLCRAVLYATPLRPGWTARRVGMTESILGGLYVGSLALAYHL